MGTGISELTLAQLADLGRYNEVIFFNDPSDTDLMKTIVGSPGVILINLGQFLNIATGEIQGDALADLEVQAAQIANATITDAKMVSSIVKEPGRVAVGRADFAGTATAAITVTIGSQVYTEADAADAPNGVWTNGASANDSAVSLAAAINGDTRAGNLYAAVVLTDTVFITARAGGTAGNATITVSAGEPAVVENLIGGAAAAVKQTVTILHTVTAAEVAVAAGAPQVIIPLPFDPVFFSWQVYDSTGGIYATEITARGTVVAASSPVPAYFLLANNGATDVQAGDIIRLVAQE